MQYNLFTVNVTNGSTTVTGATGTKFLTKVQAGNSFKVKNDPVIYQVASVTSDTELTLSTPFMGVTASAQNYQITTDYTPLFGLAEINIGDQDWPVHLTVETIRKIDSILGNFSTGITFIGAWDADTNQPAIPAASADNLGHLYRVSTSGATNINGTTTWFAGDSLISNGSVWVRIPSPEYDLVLLSETAVTSAATATTKAAEASASATSATTSASTAITKAAEASVSAATLADALQAFRQTFLGRYATDPTVDPYGNAILDGATYINTVTDKIMIYSVETNEWNEYDEAAQTATANANLSATNAAASATQAAGSASSASSSASTATTKASEASTSAINAALSATSASTSAGTATTKAAEAVVSATAASTSATNAANSESTVAGYATTASNAATTAVTKAVEASSSASTASTAAATATNAATTATDAATTATNAASTATTAKNQADVLLAAFNDLFLGAKTSDPLVGNSGQPLTVGALYYYLDVTDHTNNNMKVYNGTSWVVSYASLEGTLTAANNLADVSNASIARTNIGAASTDSVLAYAIALG